MEVYFGHSEYASQITVIVNEQVLELPALSVATELTVVIPSPNSLPDAEEFVIVNGSGHLLIAITKAKISNSPFYFGSKRFF